MSEPPAVAVVAGGFFSLQDDRLKLGSEGYSPGLLKKIEYAGGSSRSFATASESLERLAEFSISDKHVERLTERLGKERADSRDKAVAAMKGRTLRSSYKQPPAVAVISALQAVGPASKQRIGGIADQTDQPPGQGNGAILEQRRTGNGLAGSRGLLERGRPGRDFSRAASARLRSRPQSCQPVSDRRVRLTETVMHPAHSAQNRGSLGEESRWQFPAR